jgi:hypothetical protein
MREELDRRNRERIRAGLDDTDTRTDNAVYSGSPFPALDSPKEGLGDGEPMDMRVSHLVLFGNHGVRIQLLEVWRA